MQTEIFKAFICWNFDENPIFKIRILHKINIKKDFKYRNVPLKSIIIHILSTWFGALFALITASMWCGMYAISEIL